MVKPLAKALLNRSLARCASALQAACGVAIPRNGNGNGCGFRLVSCPDARRASGRRPIQHRTEPHERGFTYLGLLFLLAAMGLAAAGTVRLGALAGQRSAEQELLFVGQEFRNALQSYSESTPAGATVMAPRNFEELLRDNRSVTPKRHLRRIYADPLTGRKEWGLVKAADGTLLGFFSLSEQTPIRIDHFPHAFFYFKGKHSYRDWLFVYGVECVDDGCRLPVAATRALYP